MCLQGCGQDSGAHEHRAAGILRPEQGPSTSMTALLATAPLLLRRRGALADILPVIAFTAATAIIATSSAGPPPSPLAPRPERRP